MKNQWTRPVVLTLLTIMLYLAGTGSVLQNIVGYGVLFLGLIIVGIPHGAVDHLLEAGKWNAKKNPQLIISYLFQASLMGVIWYFLPSFALVIFLVYSSWHFGETDGRQWNLSPATSFAWGGSVLLYILGTHFHETNVIIQSIGEINLPMECPVWALFPWLLWSLLQRKTNMAITVLWLLISSQIPLLFAFGLYFIGQHSITGWQHITSHLRQSQKRIWLQSLPFHAGAWILLILFYSFWPAPASMPLNDLNQWGTFFIFLACVSLPHVISMHNLNVRKSHPNEKPGLVPPSISQKLLGVGLLDGTITKWTAGNKHDS